MHISLGQSIKWVEHGSFSELSPQKTGVGELFNSVGEPQFSFKRLQVTKNRLAQNVLHKISDRKCLYPEILCTLPIN